MYFFLFSIYFQVCLYIPEFWYLVLLNMSKQLWNVLISPHEVFTSTCNVDYILSGCSTHLWVHYFGSNGMFMPYLLCIRHVRSSTVHFFFYPTSFFSKDLGSQGDDSLQCFKKLHHGHLWVTLSQFNITFPVNHLFDF